MSRAMITESYLTDIADAIRAKNGSSDTYTPPQMAAAIEAIPTGGDVDVEALSVTQNGTYTAPTGKAYSPVTVNVSGGGGSGNILSGVDVPSAAVGSNGDIYLRYATAGLKNSAGQYINTGYRGNSNSKYVMLLKLDTAQTEQYPTPFGARSAVGAVQDAAYWCIANGYNYNVSNIGWGTVQTDLQYGAASMIGKITEISLEAGRMDVTIDSVKQTHTFTATPISDTTPVGIYTMLINGSVPLFGVGMVNMILYAFDIYESNVLVHSYRPALDGNNVACVYDGVSDEYLYHSGGGTLQYISENPIITAYAKVSGAWGNLIGMDISEVIT